MVPRGPRPYCRHVRSSPHVLFLALLVLVTSAASFHGFLLQPTCAPAEEACCSHESSESPEPSAPSEAPQDEVDCHDACCFAVSMAIATTPPSGPMEIAAPAAPWTSRVAPRRAPASLFRPPLA